MKYLVGVKLLLRVLQAIHTPNTHQFHLSTLPYLATKKLQLQLVILVNLDYLECHGLCTMKKHHYTHPLNLPAQVFI